MSDWDINPNPNSTESEHNGSTGDEEQGMHPRDPAAPGAASSQHAIHRTRSQESQLPWQRQTPRRPGLRSQSHLPTSIPGTREFGPHPSPSSQQTSPHPGAPRSNAGYGDSSLPAMELIEIEEDESRKSSVASTQVIQSIFASCDSKSFYFCKHTKIHKDAVGLAF